MCTSLCLQVLSKTVWAIVKLQLQGHHLEAGAVRDILAQIATAATTRVNDTNEFGCTLLVRGLAKQKLRHASLFKAVAHRGADISTTFTPTHISKTLWAYAALYPPPPPSLPSSTTPSHPWTCSSNLNRQPARNRTQPGAAPPDPGPAVELGDACLTVTLVLRAAGETRAGAARVAGQTRKTAAGAEPALGAVAVVMGGWKMPGQCTWWRRSNGCTRAWRRQRPYSCPSSSPWT